MAKEKNKPVPVRFNLKLLETLKEEEKIDTPQQALNFLTNFWENNRPAKGDFLGAGVQPGAAAGSGAAGSGAAGSGAGAGMGAAAGAAPGGASTTGAGLGAGAKTAPGAATVAPAKKKTGQEKEGSSAEPPPGLSGIDLSIWKAEQREKNKR